MVISCSRLLHGNGRALFLDAIVRVDKHQFGLEAQDFFFIKLRESSNDDQVTHRSAPGGRAIDRDDAAATLCAYGVCHKTLAIVDIPDMDLLVLADVAGVQQVLVNRAGAFVVQLAVGDAGAVDFGFK